MVKSFSLRSRDASRHIILKQEQRRQKFAEVAGGSIAECTAVVCCPCALFTLLAFAWLKLLSRLSKKVWRKDGKKIKSMQEERIPSEDSDASSHYELLASKHFVNVPVMEHDCVNTEEIWEIVAGKSHVGFWRNDF